MSAPRKPSAHAPSSGAEERRAAARGVAWGGVESATAALVGFLLTPLVVRTAGLEGLGLWGAAWSLAHTAGLLDLGVGASYGRFTARAVARSDHEALNATVAVGVGFHLCLSLVVAATALLLGPKALEFVAPHSPHLAQARMVLTCTLATVLIRLTLSAYRGVVAGAGRIDLLGRIGAAVSLWEGAGAAALLVSGHGLEAMALNSLLAGALACLAEAVAAHRLCPELRLQPFRARWPQYREVLAFGAHLQATRAAEILGAHVPRLALAIGPGLLSAGAYDLGARAAGVLQIFGGLPLRVIQPLASRLDARGDDGRLRSLVERSTRYVALLIAPCAALLLLDAPGLLATWTGGPAPAAAAASARLLALALATGLLVSPLRLALRGIGRPGIEAASALAGSTMNLILALLLAARFAAVGVATAALAGALTSAAVLLAGARRAPGALARGTLRNALMAPLSAGAVAAIGAWAILLASGAAAPPLNRFDAALRVLQEGAVLFPAFALVAAIGGAVHSNDLKVLRDVAWPLAAEGRR